jgi:hypothetical protein
MCKGNQEWANVIVDKEDRYEECTGGTLRPIRQREVVIEPLCAKQRELIYWPAVPRAGDKLRDPQDALIEADRLRQQLKKRRAQRPALRNNSPPLAGCFALANPRGPSARLIWNSKLNLGDDVRPGEMRMGLRANWRVWSLFYVPRQNQAGNSSSFRAHVVVSRSQLSTHHWTTIAKPIGVVELTLAGRSSGSRGRA